MTYDRTRQQVLQILWESRDDEPPAADDFDIRKQLDMDSLDFIEFLFSLENEFGFRVADDDIDNHSLYNFASLIRYIDDHRELI